MQNPERFRDSWSRVKEKGKEGERSTEPRVRCGSVGGGSKQGKVTHCTLWRVWLWKVTRQTGSNSLLLSLCLVMWSRIRCVSSERERILRETRDGSLAIDSRAVVDLGRMCFEWGNRAHFYFVRVEIVGYARVANHVEHGCAKGQIFSCSVPISCFRIFEKSPKFDLHFETRTCAVHML